MPSPRSTFILQSRCQQFPFLNSGYTSPSLPQPDGLLLAIHLEVNPTSHTPRYTPPETTPRNTQPSFFLSNHSHSPPIKVCHFRLHLDHQGRYMSPSYCPIRKARIGAIRTQMSTQT